ncbi:MAG: hypothetical protein HDR43_00250 [Mycoplasma sp.]|nr:hypothetical protein [Mycoplasma sp.]
MVKNNSKKTLNNSSDLQINMNINRPTNLYQRSMTHTEKANEVMKDRLKTNEFIKNQNKFNKLLLSFIKEQRKLNKKLELKVEKNERNIETLKCDVLLLKKLLLKSR